MNDSEGEMCLDNKFPITLVYKMLDFFVTQEK
jgi:hypothetical protein